MFCQNCKTQIPEGAGVCPVCGMIITENAPQTPQQPMFTPTAPAYNNPQQPTFTPSEPVYNNTPPTTKKRKIKGWVIGIIIGVVATLLTIIIFLAAIFLPAAISYTNRSDASKEEANLRAFYSSAWSAFTQVASEGPVSEDALYQATFNMMGDSSINMSECNIEFSEEGITSVSIPCSEGCMLTFDGSGFSGGGEKHNHGSPTDAFANDDSGISLEIPDENYLMAEAMREESNLRAFYSCTCAAFTELAVEGPVDENELYQTTFNLFGDSSIDQAEWTIEFDETGIIAVSIPCSEGGMLTYNGSYFSGGGANHNHGE